MRRVLFVFFAWLVWAGSPALAESCIGVLFDISSSTDTVIGGVTETLDTLQGRIPADTVFSLIAWQSAVVAEAEWRSTELFSSVMTTTPASGTELLPALQRWYPSALADGPCPRAIIIVHGTSADVTDVGVYIRDSFEPGAFLRVLVVPNGANGTGQMTSYQTQVGVHATHQDFDAMLFTEDAFVAAVLAARSHDCQLLGM